MMNKEEVFNDAIEQWRLARGVGTAIVPPNLDAGFIVLRIIQKLYHKSPGINTTIVCPDFKTRTSLIDYLTNEENNTTDVDIKWLIDNKLVKVLTQNFVVENDIRFTTFSILFKLHEISDVIDKFGKALFKLVVNDCPLRSNEERLKLYNICPLLPVFNQSQIDALRTSTPVEDIVEPISLANSDVDEYERYGSYIQTSMIIFGSFEVLNAARIGDKTVNKSAIDVCNEMALANGWSPTLDMSIEYNAKIDEVYNPIAISERANETYNYIRNRSNFVADYNGKLERIVEILNENKGKHILIINKRGDFANVVAEYITNVTEFKALPCHSSLKSVPATDLDGNPIYYKSGKKKGERKLMGVTTQCKQAIAEFTEGDVTVLSTNASPDKDIDIYVDVIIITSPMCNTIEEYIYRCSKLDFPNVIKLYTLYCKCTIEETRLAKRTVPYNHTIVNQSDLHQIVDNNSDFVIVD